MITKQQLEQNMLDICRKVAEIDTLFQCRDFNCEELGKCDECPYAALCTAVINVDRLATKMMFIEANQLVQEDGHDTD